MVSRCVRFAAGALFLGVAGALPAGAAEFVLETEVSERLEFDSNLGLDADASVPVFGSTTVLGATLTGGTARTDLRLDGRLRLTLFGGEIDGELNDISPRLTGSVTHRGPRITVGGDFSVSARSRVFTDIAALAEGLTGDPGEVDPAVDPLPVDVGAADDVFLEETGTEIRVLLGSDVFVALDPRNSVGLSASSRVTRFTGDSGALVPTSTFGLNLSWQREIDPTSDLAVTLGFSQFAADSAADPTTLSWELRGEFSRSVNRRLSFTAGSGISFSRTREDGPAGRSTETGIGFVGDLGVSYRLLDTRYSFRLSQKLEPSSFGTLDRRLLLRFGVDHEVSPDTSLGLTGIYSFRRAAADGTGGDDRHFFSLAATVNYTFNNDWSGRIGYILSGTDDGGGRAFSNAIFLEILRTKIIALN